MPRNINTEVEEERRDSASHITKSVNTLLFKNIGKPVFESLPPGTVIAAANIMVIIRAPTTVQEVAVSFIHFSPLSTNSLWVSVNNSRGVRPSSFVDSNKKGWTTLSTSYVY